MTSSLIRGRPRCATSHIWVRLAHTLVGALAGVMWLVLPWMTINDDVPVPAARATPNAASAGAAAQDETSATDLVLPLAVVAVVVALAGYGYARRTRRARTRTTPGGSVALAGPAAGPLSEDDERARAALVEADDCVRTSREELGFAEAQCGADAVEPFALAVRDAESELSAAFRMRQQYDEGVPGDETSRRHALAGIVGRCREAGRRLDAEAPAFDLLRAPVRGGLEEALEPAEARFRELTARTAAAETTLAEATGRYGPAATAAVTGHLEQAKDRLVFATVRFNQARQQADTGDARSAARHLRAAEAATAQAEVFVTCVERLSEDLSAAARLVPAALTGAERELAGAKGAKGAKGAETEVAGARGSEGAKGAEWAEAMGVGAQGEGVQGAGAQAAGVQEARAERAGLREADARAAGVQRTGGERAGTQGTGVQETGTQGTGVQETGTQGTGAERAGVRKAGAHEADAHEAGLGLTAGELRSLTAHAELVLAAVRREVAAGPYDPLDALRKVTEAVAPVASGRTEALSAGALLVARSAVALADGFVAAHRGALGSTARTRLAESQRLLAAEPPDPFTADALARQALALAEQDVRLYGNPIAGAAEHASGAAGAVVGGILLGGGPDGGPPAAFGGPHTRARRAKPPG